MVPSADVSGVRLATIQGMLAAYVWHWWIGAALTVVGLLALVALVAGYLKQVTAPQYPNRKQRAAMRAAGDEAQQRS
jgi:hypothetical protein